MTEHNSFPDEQEECATCLAVLQSLENIDDDADRQDIHLVKTTDRNFAAEYGIEEMPGLVFFFRFTVDSNFPSFHFLKADKISLYTQYLL